jgi:hypothetical protein
MEAVMFLEASVIPYKTAQRHVQNRVIPYSDRREPNTNVTYSAMNRRLLIYNALIPCLV